MRVFSCYLFINDQIPAAYLYGTIMQISPTFANRDPFAGTLKWAICERLKDSSFKKTELGRASHVALALQQRIAVRCDRLQCNSSGKHGLILGGLCCRYLILEQFYPILNDNGVATGSWCVVFSYPDYLQEGYTGSLEQIVDLFRFVMQ